MNLCRSINTVAQPKRAKAGHRQYGCQLSWVVFRWPEVASSQIPKQPIVEELEKQYDVEAVDPSTLRFLRTDQYDVLFVVQPSSLSPQQLPNVVEAFKVRVPTAIFEDPTACGL
jgi:ABC-2 type transport system permease protein